MNGGHLHSTNGSQHNAMRPLGIAVNSDFRDYFTVKGIVKVTFKSFSSWKAFEYGAQSGAFESFT